MAEKLSYLSDGHLFLSNDGKTFSEIESQFALKAQACEQEIAKKKEWKTSGTGAKFMGIAQIDADEVMINPQITGMTYSPLRKGLIYSLQSSTIGGLFSYDLENGTESRLFHKESFSAKDLDFDPKTGRIVCSLKSQTGGNNIGIVNHSQTGIDQITEGDSIDEMPRWISRETNTIVYQSAGIARNQQGMLVAIGNYSILKLDLSTGEIETVLEDPDYDYLLPCYNSQGDLYCIRRKYRGNWGNRFNPLHLLRDIVFFPVGLFRTLINFLNIQSLIYSKKPLITAGTNKPHDIDHKKLFLHGRNIDIQKQLAKGDEEAPLVPHDWELIRLSADDYIYEIEKGVISFDIMKDGTIVYTNGRGIYTVSQEGTIKKIGRGKLVEMIKVI